MAVSFTKQALRPLRNNVHWRYVAVAVLLDPLVDGGTDFAPHACGVSGGTRCNVAGTAAVVVPFPWSIVDQVADCWNELDGLCNCVNCQAQNQGTARARTPRAGRSVRDYACANSDVNTANPAHAQLSAHEDSLACITLWNRMAGLVSPQARVSSVK